MAKKKSPTKKKSQAEIYQARRAERIAEKKKQRPEVRVLSPEEYQVNRAARKEKSNGERSKNSACNRAVDSR